MPKSAFKAGQYYAAKYKGDNGDLIVGKIKSVRSNGEVILVNLLTNAVATKSSAVLASRNKRITKIQADRLVAIAKHTNKRDAREAAVGMPSFEEQIAKQLDFEERVAATPASAKAPEIVSETTEAFKRMILENAEIRKLTHQFVVDLVKILQWTPPKA